MRKRAKINFRLLYTLLSAAVVTAGTLAAIQYAKGNYRFTNKGFVKETGLLSANSSPTGAQVFIDSKLVTATDDTLYLEPGTYEVEIIKDGYTPWKKTMTIEKELVAQTNTLLFPNAPSLTSLTFTGVQNVSPSPDGQKILFFTASASAQAQNGLYILEMDNNLLPLARGPRLIAENVADWHLEAARFIWSPDSNEAMVIAPNGRQILLSVDKKQSLVELPDVGVRSRQILSGWEEELYLRERQLLVQFPEKIIEIATSSTRNVSVSPDKKRLMYTADKDFLLGEDILPPLPATNTQPEERLVVTNGIYVYDAEEDKNFRVGTENPTPASVAKRLLATDLYSNDPATLEASPSAFARMQATTSAQTATIFQNYYAPVYANSHQWFPDSKHIIHTAENELKIMGYDSTNDTVVYSGPFRDSFVVPWPDSSKVVIITSFSPKSPENFYAIELR